MTTTSTNIPTPLDAQLSSILARVEHLSHLDLRNDHGIEQALDQSRRVLGALAQYRHLLQTPTTALIRRRRLEQAASLLGTGTVSVKEVTFTVGFSNESSFGRAFRQHYGMAPSAYAEQAQQG